MATISSALRSPRRRSGELPESFFGFGMALPALLLTVALLGLPLVYSFWASLHEITLGNAAWQFVGIDNYASILRDPLFWPSLGRTLGFALTVTVLTTVFGLAAGLLLTTDFPGRNLFRAVLILPWSLSQTMLALTLAGSSIQRSAR
jgi:multiple sugar transport system permease protein